MKFLMLIAAALMLLPAGEGAAKKLGDLEVPVSHDELKGRLGKYAGVEMDYDESVLSPPEKAALRKLVEAGAVMDEIFLTQVWSGNAAMKKELVKLKADDGKMAADLYHFFRINFGPWDRLDHNTTFIGTTEKPAGANYYPEDMTKEEFEVHIKNNPKDADAFKGFFTTIRRKDGKLVAVPYSTEYKDELERAATLMHEAADILEKNESATTSDYSTLVRFLRSRADAFMSNEYQQSDMDWMDVEDNVIDVTIGPYEVYEDGLFGYKAAFTAFIAVRNPADSRQLDGIKRHLQALENSLPIPDEHKNPNRGSESPISVVDLVYTGGDTKAGVQTIAFNLPNDETVRELKGSKKVMLKNISHAKFDKILIPIAEIVLDPDQLQYVDFDAYFNNVLMHEMAHGLGPGTIMREDGTETTVGRELKELYSPIEEAKADITGLYCRRVLVDKGFYTAESLRNGYVSFLPGFFRSIRFGAHEAHGKANLIEFNFMTEKGAIVFNKKTQRFHVDLAKMPEAVEALTHELLMVEALGDYDNAQAFLDKYGTVTPELETLLKRLENIPVDVEPLYEAEEYIKTSAR